MQKIFSMSKINIFYMCFLQNAEPTEADMDLLQEIIARDPLSEISEQEKEMIWTLR